MQVIGIAGAAFVVGACVAFIIADGLRADRQRHALRLYIKAMVGADGMCRWEGRNDDGVPLVGGRTREHSIEATYAHARRIADATWVFPEEQT